MAQALHVLRCLAQSHILIPPILRLAMIRVRDQCAQTSEATLAECALLVDLDVYLFPISL